MAIFANANGILGVAGTVLATGALQLTGTTLPAATQYASYSQSLTAYTSNGTPPYSFSIMANGVNAFAISGQNLIVTPSIPWPVDSISIQASDSSSPAQVAVATFSVPMTAVTPAGAEALGYTRQLFIDFPTLAEIYFGAYGTNGGTKWYSGWPFSGTIPPETLFSTNAQGALVMSQLGSSSGGPNASTAVISGVRLSNGSNVPVASTLPVISIGVGYYIEYGISIISPETNTRPAVFEFPTQHNIAGTQQVDPYDGYIRFLEQDTWEGLGANEKQQGAWNGAAVYSAGLGTYSNTVVQNSTGAMQDVRLPHVYGKSYNPSNASMAFWRDNAVAGSALTQTPSGSMTPEQLAWVNGMTNYPIIGAFNDGTTPYSIVLYYVQAYGPP